MLQYESQHEPEHDMVSRVDGEIIETWLLCSVEINHRMLRQTTTMKVKKYVCRV